jgi:hypothetical protein
MLIGMEEDHENTDGWITLKAATLNVVEWLKAREENQKDNDTPKERAEKRDKRPKENPRNDFLEPARLDRRLISGDVDVARKRIDLAPR